MALGAIIALYVFVAASFAYSLRLAYSMAVNADDGGYPVLGHALHNFLALLLALKLLSNLGDVPFVLRVAALVAALVVPAANVWLICLLDRLGERRRTAARGNNEPI